MRTLEQPYTDENLGSTLNKYKRDEIVDTISIRASLTNYFADGVP